MVPKMVGAYGPVAGRPVSVAGRPVSVAGRPVSVAGRATPSLQKNVLILNLNQLDAEEKQDG
jgi:hypothetical protein